MSDVITFNAVEEKIRIIRNQPVILDSDVAELYGVQTKEINQAVKNNPDKFPFGYIVELNKQEFIDLRSKILATQNDDESLRSKILTLQNSGRGQHTKYLPKAFTEKGLYMLATILKSKQATQTTLAIVETFTKIRELSRIVAELSETTEKPKQKSLMQKSGDIIAELLDDGMQVSGTETSFEINFAVMKFKHTVKQERKNK